MVKITKRVVEAAEAQEKDYVIWDDELPGPGSGSLAQASAATSFSTERGGARVARRLCFTKAWSPETARREAKVQLGRVAGGDDPVADRQLDHKAITVKELCACYFADLQARLVQRNGLILGRGGRPKRPQLSPPILGPIERHIVPLPGTRRVKEQSAMGRPRSNEISGDSGIGHRLHTRRPAG